MLERALLSLLWLGYLFLGLLFLPLLLNLNFFVFYDDVFDILDEKAGDIGIISFEMGVLEVLDSKDQNCFNQACPLGFTVVAQELADFARS